MHVPEDKPMSFFYRQDDATDMKPLQAAASWQKAANAACRW